MNLKKGLIVAASLLLSWSPGVHASEPLPLVLVKQTTEKMISALDRERTQIDARPQRLYELVDEIVLPHFDFERMSKLVLGKYWRKASGEQRVRGPRKDGQRFDAL